MIDCYYYLLLYMPNQQCSTEPQAPNILDYKKELHILIESVGKVMGAACNAMSNTVNSLNELLPVIKRSLYINRYLELVRGAILEMGLPQAELDKFSAKAGTEMQKFDAEHQGGGTPEDYQEILKTVLIDFTTTKAEHYKTLCKISIIQRYISTLLRDNILNNKVMRQELNGDEASKLKQEIEEHNARQCQNDNKLAKTLLKVLSLYSDKGDNRCNI